MISLERLRSILDYNPKTGIFVWKNAPSANRYKENPRAGKVAGCVSVVSGYTVIHCDGKPYHAHRLAWFYAYGEWPADQIDHINMDRSDNCLCNLREASPAQQIANRGPRKDSTTGVKGVYVHKPSGRYYARIGVRGKLLHLGYHDDIKAAEAAYNSAAIEHYGEFARVS